jgi:hypothetical protein
MEGILIHSKISPDQMTKQYILEAIKRTAAENGGTPLGHRKFAKETGIRESDWHGKHWARWSDALLEAGHNPNLFVASYNEDFLIRRLIGLARDLGRWPVTGEIKLKASSDASFPDSRTFQSRASTREWIQKVGGLLSR